MKAHFLVAALGCSVLVGCGEKAGEPSDTPEAPSTEIGVTEAVFNEEGAPTVVFEAPGLHCEVCSAGVCKALEGKPGVVDVKADADTKLVTVAVDEAAFEAGTVIDAIAEANFGEATVVDEAVVDEAAEATGATAENAG